MNVESTCWRLHRHQTPCQLMVCCTAPVQFAAGGASWSAAGTCCRTRRADRCSRIPGLFICWIPLLRARCSSQGCWFVGPSSSWCRQLRQSPFPRQKNHLQPCTFDCRPGARHHQHLRHSGGACWKPSDGVLGGISLGVRRRVCSDSVAASQQRGNLVGWGSRAAIAAELTPLGMG